MSIPFRSQIPENSFSTAARNLRRKYSESMAALGWLFGGGRERSRTGGEHLRAFLAEALGGSPIEVHGELAFSDEIAVLVHHLHDPLPHFLYVTHGLSRTSTSQPVAGTQTELTLRVPAPADPTLTSPPAWPVSRLRGLAEHLHDTGDPIEPGHYMDLHAPVCAGAGLTGFIFVNDPVLGISVAPTGWVRFIYAVAVTPDELDAALSWDPLAFAGLLGDVVPLGLSSPKRASVMRDAHTRKEFERAREAEGSSIAAVESSYFAVDGSGRIDLTADAANQVLRAMRWRLGHGHTFAVIGGDTWVHFTSAEEAADPEVVHGPDHITVAVNRGLRHEILAVLDAAPGTYRLRSAPLVFHVIDPAR